MYFFDVKQLIPIILFTLLEVIFHAFVSDYTNYLLLLKQKAYFIISNLGTVLYIVCADVIIASQIVMTINCTAKLIKLASMS